MHFYPLPQSPSSLSPLSIPPSPLSITNLFMLLEF